ncbi:MAG: lysylphosphatidylglycerol synthase transmembrane domain-containing protein [Bacillota bacterium]|nr:lysylphosphatidylglycerol synthase transmembrane domain-containing protein [Bacillota bacterium]
MAKPAARLFRMRDVLAAVVLSVLGLLAVVRFTQGGLDFSALQRIRLPYILACFGLVLLDWLLEACRLMLLSHAIGQRLSAAGALRTVFQGAFFARITPFTSGGEPFQIYALNRGGVPLGHATAVIAMKSLLNGVARVCLAIAIPAWVLLTAHGWELGQITSTALTVGIAVYMVIFVMFVLVFVFRARARGWLASVARWPALTRLVSRDRLGSALNRLDEHYVAFLGALQHFGRERRGTVVLVGMLSFASWAAVMAVPVVLVRALGGASPVAEIAATAIIFYLAVNYAPTPGSSGASEVGFAALFARFVPLPLLGVLVLAWRLFTHYFGLLLGLAVTSATLARRGVQPEDPRREAPVETEAPQPSGYSP